MTAIGIAHYGGTMGLYNQPEDEWSRALAYYDHMDDRSIQAARDRERAAAHSPRTRKRRAG